MSEINITDLLKKGKFVAISMISENAGAKRRLPQSDIEKQFSVIVDRALPLDMRTRLHALIQRRGDIFRRYGIRIPMVGAHFIPENNIPKLLEDARKLEEDVRAFAKEVYSRRNEINRMIAEFNEKTGSNLEPIPDSEEQVMSRFGRFSFKMFDVKFSGSEILKSQEIDSAIKAMVEESRKKAEEQIVEEFKASLKKQIIALLREIRKAVAEGKRTRKVMRDIDRLRALAEIDPEFATLIGAIERSIETPRDIAREAENTSDPELAKALLEMSEL